MGTEGVSVNPIEELDAMRKIAEAISNLSEPAMRRVLHWAADVHLSKGASSAKAMERTSEPSGGGISQDLKARFSSLADFFSTAAPAQDADKALVVGYWFQVGDGAVELEGFALNKELKNLGHGISNITSALDTLMSRKPALVIQTKKSGTSKQARKKYKLTLEGIRAVERMIS